MNKAQDPKAFAQAQAAYCDLMAAGKGAREALAETGLSHSQGDWAWYSDPRNPQAVTKPVKLPTIPGKGEPGYEIALRQAGRVVAELRAGEHASYPGRALSWGQIAVCTDTPENAIRRFFTATGISSQGTRKNRGGRWLGDDPTLYVGNHKGVGVEDAKPMSVDRAKLAAGADDYASVLPGKVEELRKELGGRVAKKAAATKRPSKRTTKKA